MSRSLISSSRSNEKADHLSFHTSFLPFLVQQISVVLQDEKRKEKAVNKKKKGWKLSRKKSSFCLVLCAFQNGNATLIKVPIKQAIQGK